MFLKVNSKIINLDYIMLIEAHDGKTIHLYKDNDPCPYLKIDISDRYSAAYVVEEIYRDIYRDMPIISLDRFL